MNSGASPASARRLEQLFRVDKPVIAMAHFPALPGTPRYRRGSSIEDMVSRMGEDIEHLVAGGVDGILFCNEDDRPYSLKAGLEIVAVMAAVVQDLRPRDRPYGVDILWDPKAALALAKATGATFVREVVTGVYESDMGLWAPDAAELYRYRDHIDASDVMIMANITPEFASPLGTRSVAQRAKSAAVSSLVDALLIAGPMAGAEPDASLIDEAKEAVGDAVPVLLNTGARVDNIARFLQSADGVIVGSGLKLKGATWNEVDPARVRAFMDQVAEIRQAGRAPGMGERAVPAERSG